jgi:ferrous iron transport protein B
MIPRTGLPLIALAGNPNTGKTTLFNRLTGANAKVGNYPGVTVERIEAERELAGFGRVRVMDVPGTYSLSAHSREEQIAVAALAGLHPLERPDCVVLVADATQLARNLYLALQVIELELPVVLALNMSDELAQSGRSIDTQALGRELGVPVVLVSALRGAGIAELERAIAHVLREPRTAGAQREWSAEPQALAADLDAVAAEIPRAWLEDAQTGGHAARAPAGEGRRRALARWALLSLEERDELEGVPAALRARVTERRAQAARAGREIDREIVTARYAWIDERIARTLHSGAPRARFSDRIDRVLLHPALGFALFLALMALVFQSLFAWADPAISLIEQAVGWLAQTTRAALPESLATDLVVDGLIEGVGSVIVFLPQILLLFFFIGVLEDVGYMARVAYLMDRLMKSIGLHGRAFVPMLSGYACAVPAILATRTMERRRDRLLTMLVVPLMTCSARLPVYGLLIAAMVPPGSAGPFTQGGLLVAMYLFSTVLALVCAAVLGRTLLKGQRMPLILEMPPYRRPHWQSVLRMLWAKCRTFLTEAGTVILACTVAMWFLLSFPREPKLETDYAALRAPLASELERSEGARAAELDAQLAQLGEREAGERLRASYGGRLGHAIEPVIEPLGFDWKIGIGLIGAFAAREVFVSTMGVVYGLGEDEDDQSASLRQELREQTWPDGRKVYTPLACLSLMVFFAIACQCMSTLAVVRRESGGWGWPCFLFAYTALLAWVASFAVYQGGRLFGWS